MQRCSAVVSIHVMVDQGVLLLLSRVMAAPEPNAALYRRLLEASFMQTGDAAFALHPKTGDVYLRLLRGLDLHDASGAKHTDEAEAVLRGEALLGWGD